VIRIRTSRDGHEPRSRHIGVAPEENEMQKGKRLPHEAATAEDGLPKTDKMPVADDVEGHSHGAGELLPGTPGTGGDNVHRPVGTGELDGDDVEGHSFGHTKGERLSPGMPGTGGD
jgi:hypothetical protein